jgi:hypothetical protein
VISVHENIRNAYLDLQKNDFNKVLEFINSITDEDTLGIEDSLDLIVLNAKLYLELNDIDNAIVKSEEAIKASRLNQKRQYILTSTVVLTQASIFSGRNEEAQILIEQIEELIPLLSDRQKIACEMFLADFENLKGMIAQKSGKMDKALDHYQKSLSKRKRLGLQKDEGLSRYNIGSIYKFQNNTELAINQFKEALKLFEDVKHYDGISATLSSLNELYITIGDGNTAFIYEQRKIDLEEKIELNRKTMSLIKENAELVNEIAKVNSERYELEQKLWKLEFEKNAQEVVISDKENINTNILEKTSEELKILEGKLTDANENFSNLQKEVDRLKTQRASLSEEVNSLEKQNKSILELNELNKQLSQKEIEIENLYEKLKIQSEQMTVNVPQSVKSTKVEDLEIENLKLNDQIKALHERLNNLTTEDKQIKSEKMNINEIIASSRLAERLYSKMQEVKSMNLRLLAMQLGSNPTACLEQAKIFEENNFLNIQYKEGGENNPIISIINL